MRSAFVACSLRGCAWRGSEERLRGCVAGRPRLLALCFDVAVDGLLLGGARTLAVHAASGRGPSARIVRRAVVVSRISERGKLKLETSRRAFVERSRCD
jgi:hypothetical protein